MPRALWRRCRLCQISRYSKIALARSTRVCQRFRSSSSACIRDQNDSTVALSKQSPTEPIEGSSPESTARWVNAHEADWVPWSLCITVSSAVGLRLSMAMPRALVTRDAVGRESMDQPTTRRLKAPVHHRAVDLALAGGVLGDVCRPQPVRLGPSEVAVDQVRRGRGVMGLAMLGPPRHAPQPGSAHQDLHGLAAHRYAPAPHQLGVNPFGAVGLAGPGVDLADGIAQPGVPDRPSRPRAAKPAVIARHRHPQQAARPLDGETLRGQRLDGREPAFGPTSPFRSSVARRWIASSVPGSRTRLRSAASSACSAVVMPGSTPASMRAWRRQL